MKLDFPEAAIRYIDTRFNPDSAALYARVYMSACMTEEIRNVMDWDEPGHGSISGKLDGELGANTLMLVPKESTLAHHGFSVDVSEVADFTYKCETDEGGNRRRTQVNFVVRTSGIQQLMKLLTYYDPIGNGEGLATVTYHKQETLDPDAGKRVDMAPVSGASLFEAKSPVTEAEFDGMAEGCKHCDDSLDLLDDGLHHTNGEVCVVASRNQAAVGVFSGTMAERKKKRQAEEKQKASLREQAPPVDAMQEARDTAPEV